MCALSLRDINHAALRVPLRLQLPLPYSSLKPPFSNGDWMCISLARHIIPLKGTWRCQARTTVNSCCKLTNDIV